MAERENKPALLFLCHRIPYPPDKGDKIRSFHLLRFLAGRYRVYLGAFVDDPDDWRHQACLQELCEQVRLLKLNPLLGRLRSLRGLLDGRPLSLPYYRQAAMRNWVNQVLSEVSIRRIVVFSSTMAQYLDGPTASSARRIIDFVDVDSDKWRQYAESKPVHSAWLFQREALRLEDYDKAVAHASDVSVFVSPDEAALFRRLLGDSGVRVEHMTNGVDTAYFSPEHPGDSPYPVFCRPIVFTGAMDYWANVDAVHWFCGEVMPWLRAHFEGLFFYIVGSHPTDEVRRLAAEDVVVTGRVEDVRPYLAHAELVVAPMQIARGIQNKVLEGMSMARPVVVTAKGLEGIDARNGDELLVADEPMAYAGLIGEILDGGHRDLGDAARDRVCRLHSWAASLERFAGFIEG